MEYEGIYRKSGPMSQINRIIAIFNRGEGALVDFENLDEWNDITAITSAVKQYFRELPEGLLTAALYQDFKTTIRMF